MSTPAYTTREGDPAADAGTMLDLWSTGLGQNGMPQAKLDWYYRDNPEGTPRVLFLCNGEGRDVGVAAIGPRRMRLGQEEIEAGALIDFIARPEHRTFFPAITLQRDVRRLAVKPAGRCDLLFGFPNPQSLAIVKRVGYFCAGNILRRTRVLRAADYLAKYFPLGLHRLVGPVVDALRNGLQALQRVRHPGYRNEWQDEPDASYDDLWRRAAAPGRLMGVRDRAFLAWRFCRLPGQKFRFFALRGAANCLAAYAVCTGDGNALQVHDFLADPAEASAACRLWLDLSRAAFARGYSSITVELMADPAQHDILAARGFRVRASRPVYAAAAESDARFAGGSVQWYLTDADDDW